MGYLSKRGSRAARVCLACATAVAVTVTVVGPGQAPPSYAAAGTVTGSVFQDFDGDGTRDAGNTAAGVQTDIGFAGVTVTAYGPHNVVVGTAATAANGSYTINTTSVPDGTPLRIEFTDANGGTTPDQLPGDFQSSFHGADNSTSVQFAAAGDENVDFGVLEPEDFADNNAPIVTAIQYAGLRTAAGSTNLPAVVANPWVVPANDPTPPANTTYPGRIDLASYGAVGSVWGTAFNRRQNAAYAAATYKRVSDMGPLGLGGIYRIPDVVNQATGALNPSPGAVEPWLDVDALPGVDLGTIPANRQLGAPNALVRDPDAFTKAGKVGIGGIAVTEDGSTLFFVNLFDKNLYALDIAGGATPNSATQIPLNLGADQRPWAVAVHRDRVYVGYVDTGGDGAVPGNAATGNFYVDSQPVADAVAGGTGWRNDLSEPLSYTKGNNITAWGNTIPAGDGFGATPTGNPPTQVTRWNSWTDSWYWGTNESVGFNTSWGWTHIYPQAILGSLAFDADGFLVLGFVDRASVQAGNRQWASVPPPGCAAPCTADQRFFETISSGDILVAEPAAGGGFTLENNGVAGARIGHGGAAQGPGGGEFIFDRQNLGTGSNHYENTLGGIATYPGVPQVASTAMDPIGAIRLAGLAWFSLANGAAVRGYNHTDDPLVGPLSSDPTAPTAAYFQKGGGLGAVSILTREPPVEIGNRVWLDADFNGRQDSDEPAIEGAPVELFARGPGGTPVGAPLASTTTDAAGEYYFRSDEIPGLDPAATEGDTNPYVVVFGHATGAVNLTGPNADHPGFAGITWADLDFTTPTSAELQRDSNPAPATPDAATGLAPVDVGSSGRNDHTIDAGFHATGAFQIKKVTEGGAPAPGQTFTFDVTAATNFRGDDVLSTINPKTFTIHAGEIAPAVPQQLPVGTEITIQERGGDPSYDPGATQVITVNDGEPLLFTVTNQVPPPTTPRVRTVTSHGRVTPGQPFYDRIYVSGLAGAGGTTAVARLYGPFTSRAAATCSPGLPVRTRTLTVHNGLNRTSQVRVSAPGVYTWQVTLRANAENRSATHPCGQAVETTTVAKQAYVAPVIVAGFSGTLSSPDFARRAPAVTIRMPAIGLRARVIPERVIRRKMTLPANVGAVGWLRKSAGIGDKIGTTVIGGHVSDRHDNPGALFRLSRAHTGQQIAVARGGTPRQFKVVSKKTFDRRHKLPQRYFVTAGRHRLVLISCTNRVVYHNRRFHYTRYIVVVANEIPPHR